jgi:hypothetical protein
MKGEVGARAFDNRGVALAGLSALIGAAVCLAFALFLAIVLPATSYLAIASDSDLLGEALAYAISFSQANMYIPWSGEGLRTVPVLFALIPTLGVAAGVAVLAPRTHGIQVRERILWGAAAGLPFAALMAALCLGLGEFKSARFETQVRFSADSVMTHFLLWGSLGGLLGMLFDLRRRQELPAHPISPASARYVGAGWAALRPLLLALAVIGLLGTLAWARQAVHDDSYSIYPDRSTAVAIGEQIAYAGDHAINILPLGVGAREELDGLPALPIEPEDIPDVASERPDQGFSPSYFTTYGLFDYDGTMPPLLFVLTTVVLIGTPVLLALYAGFAVARRVGETRPARAAAWGALVGPVWALTMVLLTALARKGLFGDPTGDSVLVSFLLGGAILGAVGGLLAMRQTAGRRSQAASKLGA